MFRQRSFHNPSKLTFCKLMLCTLLLGVLLSCKTTPKINSPYAGKDYRVLDDGFLAIWEDGDEYYECYAPIRNRLSHAKDEVEFSTFRSSPMANQYNILAVIPKHGTFHIEKEVTHRGCGGITTPRTSYDLVLGYYLTHDGKKIEFVFPTSSLEAALKKDANEYERFGPAIGDEYRQRYLRLQLASEEIPPEPSLEEAAIEKVKTGTAREQRANLEYLIREGVNTDEVFDLYVKHLSSKHLRKEAIKGIRLVQKFERSHIEKLKGAIGPWHTSKAINFFILDTILHSGLLSGNSEDIDYVLGVYNRYGPSTLTPALSLALELGDKEVVIKTVLGLRSLIGRQSAVDLTRLYRGFKTDRKKLLLEALGNISKPKPRLFPDELRVRGYAKIPYYVYEDALASEDPGIRLVALESIRSNLGYKRRKERLQIAQTEEYIPFVEQSLTDKDSKVQALADSLYKKYSIMVASAIRGEK